MKNALLCGVFALLIVCFGYAAGESEKAESEEKTLVFWSHYGQSPPFVQAFADTANEILPTIGYDNVKVKAEVIEYDGYMTKYQSAFSAGEGPDIFVGRARNWALEGGVNPVAAPLPADVEKTIDEQIAPMFKAQGVVDGKRYGWAVEGAMLLLYYNKDHFEEVGLDPNNPPLTVDEFTKAAIQLTRRDSEGNIERSGYMPRFLGGGGGVGGKYTPFVHIFGGRVVSPDYSTAQGYINGPNSLASFQWYYDLVYKHKVVNLAFERPEPAFQQGLTSMIFREQWFEADTSSKAPDINFGVAPFIIEKESITAAGWDQSWTYMINNNSEYREICFELFKAMQTREADLSLHQPAGYPPVLKDTLQNPNDFYRKLRWFGAMKEELNLNKQAPPFYDFAEWPKSQGIMGDAVSEVVQGADPKETIDSAAERIDELLAGGL